MSTAKERIEAFAKRQHEWHYPCPRCGRDVMDDEPARNAMSRRVNVQVCDDCGTLEAFEDMPGGFQAPLEVWAIMKYPPRWGMPLQLAFVGRDSWSRPVYECGGKYYVDTDPRADRAPSICTKQDNEFDGEPCDPLPPEVEVEFIPCRDTW